MNNSYTPSQITTMQQVPSELVTLCKRRQANPFIASQKAVKGLTGEIVVTYTLIDRDAYTTSQRASSVMRWTMTIGKRGKVKVKTAPYIFRDYIYD